MPDYPKSYSDVIIEYVDGQVKEFRITANPKIASYLVQQGAQTGVIVLRNDDTQEVLCVPSAQVSSIRFKIADGEAAEK